jgi:DNA (cytosine-5)-methyltransferase 1
VPPIVNQAMSSKWSKGSSGPAGDEVANLVAHALRADGFDASEDGTGRSTPIIAFQPRFARNDRGAPSEIAYPLTAEAGRTGKGDSAQCVVTGWAVRRLMPIECERLQGFPDNYTAIPRAADGPRYKALGNSMAVNVMAWLGRRIEMVHQLRAA